MIQKMMACARRLWRWLTTWTMRRVRRYAVGLATMVAIGTLALAALMWGFPFPREKLDRWPASPVVTDRQGRPLLALVGSDDQWRFPMALDDASPWLVAATIAVEDGRFRTHGGVDAIAVARAAWQNLAARRIVSGASTLTMQVCRMMDERPRTFWAKAVESFRALELERIITKDEILCA